MKVDDANRTFRNYHHHHHHLSIHTLCSINITCAFLSLEEAEATCSAAADSAGSARICDNISVASMADNRAPAVLQCMAVL